ncbi:MAG TPA: DHHA1 domain-containing protein [Pyrinomonadaceae bacterium]|jgi:alanyl-tRNA synthetase|nr:DHHA1 domain-containing protein [Pyrinomonadaceae bacterium]
MPPTERLYYYDSHLIEFEALVTDKTDRVSGWAAVTLDRTAFYPTGGGQPSDTGTLNGERVLECIDDEDNGVLHVIQGRAPEVGATVKGRVDWSRRLDHIQQHTGQHILSQAFVTLFNAPTRGFRVLSEVCEIDVEITNPTNELIERAVELANNVIWEDRQITITTATAEEATQLPLRKDPSRDGDLRLIEIEGFDLTPCGGTHAYRTGEVGMIVVRHWERAKGLTRIEFAAGTRALADYRRANKTGRAVATLFSAGRDDAAKLAARMVEENKELHRRLRHLEEIAARVEADELLATASANASGVKIITHIFPGRDAESLKRVALALISHPNTIALLGSRDEAAARLVFAKAADAPGDMNALMRAACETLEGRGGGKPDMAQGGGKNVEKLEQVIEDARQVIG